MKKIICLFIFVFILSGCSFKLASKQTVPEIPTTSPRATSTATTTPEITSPVATTSEIIKNYKNGKDYSIFFLKDYFVANPTVSEISCNFDQHCPCLVDAGITDIADQASFCQRIPTNTKENIAGQDFCVQAWGDGAAGSIYMNYAYTMKEKNSNDRCIALQFVKRFVNDCQVYSGNDLAIKKCEAEKADAPEIIKTMVASLKMATSSLENIK